MEKSRKAKKKKVDVKRLTKGDKIVAALDQLGKDHGVELLLMGSPPECTSAIVGVAVEANVLRVVYDAEKYIVELMKANKWDRDDAQEWFDFNTVRGLDYDTRKNKPILIYRDMLEDYL